jgi:polar amino acid transport system substrate-binding protein
MGVFAVSVQAEDKPIYRVGIEDVDYYPMFTKKGDRYKTSFLIDVMELFAQKRGVKFEYIHLPISRFEEWYQQDSIDFRLPDNPMWNTNTENLVFSGDIIELRADTVVLKKNQHKPVSTLKVLGSLYGFVPGAHWGNHINTGRTKFVFESSMPVLVGLLKREMVDGLDVNLTVVHHHANELRYNTDDFVASTEAPNVQYTYALSTIAHPEIIKDFDAFLVASQNEISLLKQRKDIFDSKQ